MRLWSTVASMLALKESVLAQLSPSLLRQLTACDYIRHIAMMLQREGAEQQDDLIKFVDNLIMYFYLSSSYNYDLKMVCLVGCLIHAVAKNNPALVSRTKRLVLKIFRNSPSANLRVSRMAEVIFKKLIELGSCQEEVEELRYRLRKDRI